jgi:hypothetical protein
VAVCRTALFAYAHGSLYRSLDAGETWELSFSGQVNAIEASDSVTYLASGSGVQRSSDQGGTWIPVGFAGQYVPLLHVSGQTVIVGTQSEGLQRSTDQGVTWTPVLNPGGTPYGLAAEGATWFAGINPYGIYRSGDGGEHWDQVFSSTNWGTGLAVSGSVVLASAYRAPCIARSSDGGAHWEELPGLTDMWLDDVAIVGDTAFASGNGVFRSLDAGATWQALPTAWQSVTVLATSEAVLYANADGRGLYRSPDRGQSWRRLDLQDSTIVGLSIAPDAVYAASYYSGLYRSTNQGLTWQTVITGPVNQVASREHVVLAAASDGVECSPDAGATWRAGLFGHSVTQVGLTAAFAWAGTAEDGLFRSSDGGTSWQRTAFAGKSINALAVTGDAVYATGSMGSGVYRSADQGVTWEPSGLQGSYITHLVADEAGVYAFDGTQVYASADGAGWIALADRPTSWWVAELHAEGHRVYLGTLGNSLWVHDLPELALAPTRLDVHVSSGDPDVITRTVAIQNVGAGTLQWSASASGADWLAVQPISGTLPGDLRITVSKAGLPAGVYTATLTVTATGALRSPQSVPVRLTVAEPGCIAYLPCVLKPSR